MMRTTLTIDDDLAIRIEKLRRSRGLSLKKIINSLLRDALELQSKPLPPRRFRTTTYKLGLRAGYDATKLSQLVDELEVEAFAEKQAAAGQ
jgi:hypothetical protein